MILAQLIANFAHASTASLAMFFQDAGAPRSRLQPDAACGPTWAGSPSGVVIILFIMSIYSLAVIIDRCLYFSAARKQSREFAPKVAGALKEGRLDEAIKVADRSKKSHLAEVVTAGLQEFRSFGSGGSITDEQVESSKRALERSESIVHAKLKKGLGGLATIGSTAPFIGLFGTVIGILNAFQAIATRRASGIGAGCRRYFGSSGYDRVRSAGRYPRRYDVQLLHQQGGSVRRRDGQQLVGAGGLLHQAEPPLNCCGTSTSVANSCENHGRGPGCRSERHPGLNRQAKQGRLECGTDSRLALPACRATRRSISWQFRSGKKARRSTRTST